MGRAPHMYGASDRMHVESHPNNVWLVIGWLIVELDEDARAWLIDQLQKAAPTGSQQRTAPEYLPPISEPHPPYRGSST